MQRFHGELLITNELLVLDEFFKANTFPMYYPSILSFEYNPFYEFKGQIFLPVLIHLWAPLEEPLMEESFDDQPFFHSFTEVIVPTENILKLDSVSFARYQAKSMNRQLFDFIDEWLLSEVIMQRVRFHKDGVIEAEDLYQESYFGESFLFSDREEFWQEELDDLLEDRLDWWELYERTKKERGYND